MKDITTKINESSKPFDTCVEDIIDILLDSKYEPKDLLEAVIRRCAAGKLNGYGADDLKEYANYILKNTTND